MLAPMWAIHLALFFLSSLPTSSPPSNFSFATFIHYFCSFERVFSNIPDMRRDLFLIWLTYLLDLFAFILAIQISNILSPSKAKNSIYIVFLLFKNKVAHYIELLLLVLITLGLKSMDFHFLGGKLQLKLFFIINLLWYLVRCGLAHGVQKLPEGK